MQIDNGTALCVSANFFALGVFLLQLLSDKLQKRKTWWEQDPPLFSGDLCCLLTNEKTAKKQNKTETLKKTAKQL